MRTAPLGSFITRNTDLSLAQRQRRPVIASNSSSLPSLAKRIQHLASANSRAGSCEVGRWEFSQAGSETDAFIQAAHPIPLQVDRDVLVANRAQLAHDPLAHFGIERARGISARPNLEPGQCVMMPHSAHAEAETPQHRFRRARSSGACLPSPRNGTESATRGTRRPAHPRSAGRRDVTVREYPPWSGPIHRAGCARRTRQPPFVRADSRRGRRRCCRRRSPLSRERRRGWKEHRTVRACRSNTDRPDWARYSGRSVSAVRTNSWRKPNSRAIRRASWRWWSG